MNRSNIFDITILGSGFAGSLLAAILSKQGLSVCVIDRGKHPRFAIGESSTPAADMILESLVQKYHLDVLRPFCRYGSWCESYPEIDRGCKRGFSYIWHGSKEGYTPTHNHQNELLVAASEQEKVADTQWCRADVDHFFSKYSVELGATLFEECSIKLIEHVSAQQWQVSFRNRQEELLSVKTNFIVDGTGPSAVLLKTLRVPEMTSQLYTNTSAIFSHFINVPKLQDWFNVAGTDQSSFPYPVDDSAVHHLRPEGWLWQLRFDSGLTSLGFVAPDNSFSKTETQGKRCDWDSIQVRSPFIASLTQDAVLAEKPGKMIFEDRLQRLFEFGAGKDWAALPFTIGFIDPMHSTGIAHSLLGVQRLAEILINEQSAHLEAALHAYSDQIIRELKLVDLLVSGCYSTLSDFEKFTAWAMLYFTCATNFEKNYQAGSKSFLCADDQRLTSIIEELFSSLIIPEITKKTISTSDFVQCIRESIAPYNFVGLFEPDVNNMYRYTAAKK